jgi:hypothetical protein
MNTKIELTDNGISATNKISEMNPGAMKVCISLLENAEEVDPDNALGGIGCLLSLDAHGIYGASIWMLYKDVCGEDIVKTIAVLRSVQLGLLEESKLIHAIENRGDGIIVDDLYNLVKERLPAFNAA